MISVIIPVFKNKKQFFKNLETNLKYLKNEEVIVINDDPADSLKNNLKEFKNVVLLENKKNLGFGESVNKGVQQAKNRLVMFLNNDVILLNSSYKLGIKHFQKDRLLFAVSFAQQEKDESIVGKNNLYWKNGMIHHQRSADLLFGNNAWAEGGACLVDKKKFSELGGFDSVYYPFYWEDIDLSYRAWKAGYRIIFDPQITVEHHHESTIKKYFSLKFIKKIAFRNQFIFMWKNITDWHLILNHLILLPFNLFYYYVIRRETPLITGFYEALKSTAWIIKKRKETKRKSQLEDHQILQLFNIT